MPVSADYYNTSSTIHRGATVFIGEQGLNVTPALMSGSYFDPNGVSLGAGHADAVAGKIGWWASAASLLSTNPTTTVQLAGQSNSFTISTGAFVGYPGNWYIVNQTTQRADTPAIFTVADPQLSLKIWDFTYNTDMTGKSVPQEDAIGFGIETNLQNALDARYRSPVYNSSGTKYTIGGNPVTDGYIDILVRDESGTTYTSLWNSNEATGCATSSIPLWQLNVSTQPWKWGLTNKPSVEFNWSTGSMINGQYAYPVGTYTVTAVSRLNNMRNNYKNAGADYTGKTVSATQTLTIVADTLSVEANKDSVVRGKPFSITITGKPNTIYHVWVNGTGSMTGAYDDQPPFIGMNQDGIRFDPPFPIDVGPSGDLVYANRNVGPSSSGYIGSLGSPVWNHVAKGTASAAARNQLKNGSYVSANVTTSVSCTRTVEFITTPWTKAQKYTIHVEKWDRDNEWKSADAKVRVEKGAITIAAPNPQIFNPGDDIKLSGINTASYKTYLFLTGTNMQAVGSRIQSENPPESPVINENAATFKSVDVSGDNTWSWYWDTSDVAIDEGTYTIYAVSTPNDKDHLENTTYATVSIKIKNSTYPINPGSGIPFENTISLSKGWNFISTPVRLASGINNTNTFSGVDLAGHSIYIYDAQNAKWKAMSGSDSLQPLEGIWVYSNNSTDVTITPDANPLQTPPTKKLYAGWNAIGSTGIYPATARDTLFSVSEKWTTLLGYNSSLQRPDISIINGGSGLYADTRTLPPANGYWIFMKSSGGDIAAISS